MFFFNVNFTLVSFFQFVNVHYFCCIVLRHFSLFIVALYSMLWKVCTFYYNYVQTGVYTERNSERERENFPFWILTIYIVKGFLRKIYTQNLHSKNYVCSCQIPIMEIGVIGNEIMEIWMIWLITTSLNNKTMISVSFIKLYEISFEIYIFEFSLILN